MKKNILSTEQRIIDLINYTVKYPYSCSPRKLAVMFALSEAAIYELGQKLALDIIGRDAKNKRIEIEAMIKYESHLTAPEMSERADLNLKAVYAVGKKMNHRFETQYTKRLSSYNAAL